MHEEIIKTEIQNEDEGEKNKRLVNRFRMALILCVLVHTILCVIFYVLHVNIMFVFNCFSVVLYIMLCRNITQENSRNCMLITYWEILLHSMLACYILGWASGFALYIIAMMPVAFYVFYMSALSSKKKKYEPYVLSLVAVSEFLVMRMIDYIKGGNFFLENDMVNIERILYVYNTMVACGLILMSAMIFANEARINQKELKEKNEELMYLASIDPLTNLLNRRSMKEYLANAHETYEKTNSRYFIAIGDIDNFKKVNDTYGHDCGDEVILKVPETMVRFVEKPCRCGRWGGEEFIILMHGIDEKQAYDTIEDIRKCMEETLFLYQEQKVNITITFGLAAIKEKQDLRDVILAADRSLYKGKETGKNKVVLSV